MGTVNLCSECDAPPGECSHGGARYLEPIVYEKAEGGWRVPLEERVRWELAPLRPSLIQRGPVDPDRNPFDCAGCGAPLSDWSRTHGFRYCTKDCRLANA